MRCTKKPIFPKANEADMTKRGDAGQNLESGKTKQQKRSGGEESEASRRSKKPILKPSPAVASLMGRRRTCEDLETSEEGKRGKRPEKRCHQFPFFLFSLPHAQSLIQILCSRITCFEQPTRYGFVFLAPC